MRVFLTALFSTSLAMSAAILLLILINKAAANRVSAKFRYYMWLFVLLGLLIPVRPRIPLPFEPVELPMYRLTEALGAVGGDELSAVQIQADETQEAPTRNTGAALRTDIIAQNRQEPYGLILFGVWVTGVTALLAFHLRTYFKFMAYVRRWGVETADNRMLSVLRSLSDDMGIEGARVKVKACAFVSSPMLLGFYRPTILLPEKQIPLDELEHIFRHELTHYKRKDLWINLLVLLVVAMHWFNPFVYLMARAMRNDCEAACDEAVICGGDTEKRRHYGEAIIGFVGTKSAMTPALSTYFYGGSNSMKKRLSAIMDAGRKRNGLAAICAIALVAVMLLSCTPFETTAPSNDSAHIDEAVPQNAEPAPAELAVSQTVEQDANPTVPTEGEKSEQPSQQTASSGKEQYIGETKAKVIALEHAGLTETRVEFTKAKLDNENGRVVYDIEFYSGTTEYDYDYEIDASSGDILEHDKEIERVTTPSVPTDSKKSEQPSQQAASNGTEQYIGEAKAKAIALSAAKLSESQVSRMRVKLDREDGIMVYEVDFNNGRTEYEYEIDAVSGRILQADIDYDD